jgi:hypothetical protein
MAAACPPAAKEKRVPKGDIETYFEDDVWKNKIEGSLIEHSVYERKVTAVLVGSDMARSRKVEHIIKNKDGTISERNSYRDGSRNASG